MPELRIIHRGPRYVARFLRCTEDRWAVIHFEYWLPAPTLDGEFSSEGFCRHRGLNAIGIMAAENDWYQDDEILDVLAAIRAATPGWRLIGYGGSMGGFAVINFAQDLGLASLVAVSPQFSIDTAKAPYETNWGRLAAGIAFNHDKIGRIPRFSGGWMIFDPWCTDRQHVRDINRHHAIGELAVPFGGHALMQMLQQADVYTDMITDMLGERFDPAAFRRRWRRARRGSATFWLSLAGSLLARGRTKSAFACVARARALKHPDPAWFDLIEADIHIAAGNYGVARGLASAWAEDPAFKLPALERLALLPALPAPPGSHPRPLWRRVLAGLRRVGWFRDRGKADDNRQSTAECDVQPAQQCPKITKS